MRIVGGCLLVLLAYHLFLAWGGELAAQRPTGSLVPTNHGTSGEAFTTHSLELADGRQQITVVDARSKALAVYQIDPKTGAIALKSVRNLHWDLQVEEFNSGGNPSPKEIRALLEQRP